MCVFCEIVNNDPLKQIIKESRNSILIEPMNPIKDGSHYLVIPKYHVEKSSMNPQIISISMVDAIKWASDLFDDFNIVINNGENAHQTVFHTHIHIVGREYKDNLRLLRWENS